MDKRIENFLKVLSEKYSDESFYVWQQVYSDLLKLEMTTAQKQTLIEGYTQVREEHKAAKWDVLFTEVAINNKLPEGYFDTETKRTTASPQVAQQPYNPNHAYPYTSTTAANPLTGVSTTSNSATTGAIMTNEDYYARQQMEQQKETMRQQSYYSAAQANTKNNGLMGII